MRNKRCVRRCLGSINTCDCASCKFNNGFEERALAYFNSLPFRVIAEESVFFFVNTVRDEYPQKSYSVLLALAYSVQEDINEKRKLANV